MLDGERLGLKRFVVPVSFAALLVLSSPFVGQLRTFVRSEFPGVFRYIIGGSVGAAIVAALAAAVREIRTERLIRYGLLIASLVLGVMYALSIASGDPNVDVVERFHFVEYGALAFLFYRAWRPVDDSGVIVLAFLSGFIVAAFDEWLQWFVPARVGEMRDVFLDGAALACGLLFSAAVGPLRIGGLPWRQRSMALVGRLTAVALIVFAVFLQTIHLGYDVQAREIGSFRSRYTLGELDKLQRDRTSQWIADPPVMLKRVSREDQYLAEGLWHTRARNEAWARGDLASALAENRILEKFFAPVLDTKTYEPGTGQRWPPEQKADAESRAVPSEAPFVSHAEPLPIFVWPRWVFWSVTAAVVAAVLAVSY